MLEAWTKGGQGGSGLSGLRDQIQICGADLETWGSSKSKLETEEIKRLQKKLELLNASEMTKESRNKFLLLSKQLDDLLLKQEIFWRQRSRVFWLKYGDRNLNFFTPRLPKEGEGILLRESRMLMGIGWRRWRRLRM